MSEFSQESIALQLTTQWLGQHCYYFEEIGSTNSWLKERWHDLPHGAMVVTDYQSAGKGRLGRQWSTPRRKAIAVSIFFEPSWQTAQANWLTMMAGLAAVRAIHTASKLSAQLKWPNDIVFADEQGVRKVGGILLEGDFDDGRLQRAILGIGINVNLKTAELPDTATPATSLLIEGHRRVSRLALLNSLLINLEQLYDAAVRWESPQEAWAQQLINIGQAVEVYDRHGQVTVTGTAVDTDKNGHLLVRDQQGQMHTITAGDVSLRQ